MHEFLSVYVDNCDFAVLAVICMPAVRYSKSNKRTIQEEGRKTETKQYFFISRIVILTCFLNSTNYHAWGQTGKTFCSVSDINLK